MTTPPLMRSDDELDRCTTCQNTRLWHRENNPSHPFNDGSLPASATFGKRRTDGQGNAPTPDVIPQASAWPFDPVLRQALMDRGVLVPQDLRDAEEKIRATTATFVTGGAGGGVIPVHGPVIGGGGASSGGVTIGEATYVIGGDGGAQSTA